MTVWRSTPLDLSVDDGGVSRSSGAIEPKAEVRYPVGAGAGRESSSRPVLVYFPGWDGTRIENEGAIRALLVHGFVVAAVTYPARAPGVTRAALQRQRADLRRPLDFASDAAFADSVRRATDRVRARARDASRVLDALARVSGRDESGPLARVDPGKAGIFGYSLGGAVAAQAAWTDPRFKAAANLDGWHFAEAAEHGIGQPYLLLSSAGPLPAETQLRSHKAAVRNEAILTDTDYRRTMDNLRRNGGVFATVSGTTHASFSDAGQRRPIRFLRQRGIIDAPPTQRLLGTCLAEFFAQSLGAGAEEPVRTWAARFAQLRIEIFEKAVMSPPVAAATASQTCP